LKIIYEKTCPSEGTEDNGTDCVIMGDFNFGEEGEEATKFLRSDFVDAWTTLHSGEEGSTLVSAYNYNSETKSISQRKTGRRFDRILIRSHIWKPKDISMIGTSPFELTQQKDTMQELKNVETSNKGDSFVFPSDHFGLKCVLQVEQSKD
jgi:hypothetical protein